MGLAGQWLGSRCAWSIDPVCDVRYAHNPNPGARRRPLDRPDRTLSANLQELGARIVEERHYHSAPAVILTNRTFGKPRTPQQPPKLRELCPKSHLLDSSLCNL